MTSAASSPAEPGFVPSAPRFVHLRLHSEYSITDGIVQIDQAIAAAAESVVKLPFHAQLTVGQRAPAGAYRRDMTLTLVYQ